MTVLEVLLSIAVVVALYAGLRLRLRDHEPPRYRIVSHDPSCGIASCDRPDHMVVRRVEAWTETWTDAR